MIMENTVKYGSEYNVQNVKNNKGFTLIELLAVIVIMGVLMMVAIPQVTKYIENSKKDAYVETSKSIYKCSQICIT